MANVPADIVHEFTFTSPRADGEGYDHHASVELVSRNLSLPPPFDKGDWTITHTKEGDTITFSLGWKGIRPEVLKDLEEVTQVIESVGNYEMTHSSHEFQLDHKTSSKSQVNYLAREGKVSLMLDHSGTSTQMDDDIPSTATYTYTVSFSRLPKVPQVMDQAQYLHAAKSAKIYLNIIDRQHANDVRFFFPSNNRELWANSTNLISASPYFRALLASDYEEGMKRTRVGHEENRRGKQDRIEIDGIGSEDSDDGRDEEEGEFVDPKGTSDNIESNSTPTYHEVVISSTAYTTYKSILLWIHSSYINFAPLSSSGPHNMEADVEGSDHSAPADENLISASPKSVYRLAHLLDLPELCQLALDSIESQLTPFNVALELFGNLAGVYDDLRKIELDYFIANYDAVLKTTTMDVVKQRAIAGELTHYPSTSMEVMERLTSIK